MISLFGLPFGTLSQIGSFVALVGLFAGMVTVWIKGMPERSRVANEARQLDINEAESLRVDYAKQIREFRAEVHGYRNDLAKMETRLSQSERTSSRRSDVIKDMMFIIRLLISELKRIEPKSVIVGQAEAMVDRMGLSEVDKTDPLAAAKATEACAHETVATIQAKEAK
jgi:hypothetical protein